MGTRHLIAVMKDGEYKVAQYGQWDGYPSGQGLTALHFLRDKLDREKFLSRLATARFVGSKETKRCGNRSASISKPVAGGIDIEQGEKFRNKWPYFSRDNGAEILGMIQDRDDEILLTNGIDFASDSLFCEFAYVVDFDKNTFEAYKGFNENPVPAGERFADFPVGEAGNRDGKIEYYPIRHLATFDLNNLPNDEEFLAATKDKDEEGEDGQAAAEA